MKSRNGVNNIYTSPKRLRARPVGAADMHVPDLQGLTGPAPHGQADTDSGTILVIRV